MTQEQPALQIPLPPVSEAPKESVPNPTFTVIDLDGEDEVENDGVCVIDL